MIPIGEFVGLGEFVQALVLIVLVAIGGSIGGALIALIWERLKR